MTTPTDAYAALAATDSGWINLSLVSADFTPYSTGSGPAYRRIGDLVEVVGVVSPTASGVTGMGGTGAVMFTLPAAIRPTPGRAYVCQGSGTARWAATIISSGNVLAGRYAGGTLSTSSWLPFNFTYYVA